MSVPQQNLPVPDPTDKTTGAIQHEIGLLKEMVTMRMNAMDKAMDIFSENMNRVPTQLDKAISGLREVIWERFCTEHQKFATVDEKFSSVDSQFHERDTRVDQTARASKEALDAALQAAKEAVGKQNDSFVTSIAKSETATAKQIDQLVLLQNASANATNDKIEDIKTRLAAAETAVSTRRDVVTDRQAAGGQIANWGGLIVGALLALMAFATFLARTPH